MNLKRLAQAAVNPLSAIGASFIVAAVIIALSGGSPVQSFASIFSGAFGSSTAFGETLVKTTPLILTGLAIALGLRAGLFNIGAEGQLLVGALAAAWVGYAFDLPAILHVPLCLVAGVIGGAAWGLIPGLLKAKRGVHEVISTIMLNYIAFYFTHYMVAVPMKDAATMAPQTPEMHESARLAVLMQAGNLHAGIIIAILCVAGLSVLLWKSRIGYELRAVGLGPDAARTAGISVPKTVVLAMVLSGGLAGIAGAVEVMGVHHKFYDQFSPGYGFDSIAVALLGNNTAIGTALSAFLFGALKNGALNMQLDTETPKEIVTLIQAIVIVFAGTRFFRSKKQSVKDPAGDDRGGQHAVIAADTVKEREE
ncbi:MAG: ABC transporter permease [Armatimonadota bacterium]